VRVAPPVHLSPEEREQLERWARRGGASPERAQRARIVLAAADGLSHLEVAARVGVSRITAARWRNRFLAGRSRALLAPEARLVQKARVSEAQVRAIVRAAAQGVGAGTVSSRSVARSLRLSHTTVHRIWSEYRVRPSRYDARPVRPDPLTPLRPTDVLGLFLRSTGYLLAVAAGRVGTPTNPPTEVSEARADPGWREPAGAPGPGLGWHGVLQHLEERAPALGRNRDSLDVLRFLERVRRNCPETSDLIAHVLCPSAQSDPLWRRWLLRHPRVQVNFAADRDAWMRQAAGCLYQVGINRPLPRRLGASGETSRALERFLSAYSGSAAPFVWAATPSEATSGRAALGLRYDLSVTAARRFMSPPGVYGAVLGDRRPDPRARELARVVVRRCLRVRPGERVTVETWTSTLDYANALVLETLRVGGQPLLLYQDEPTYWAATAEVRPVMLARLGEHHRAAAERTDVLVSFFGPSDRERYHALPRATAFKLGERRDALFRAAERAGARAVEMAIGRVSPASARMYGVDPVAWRDELVEATVFDPEVMHRSAQPIVERLRSGREVSITHPNGTDLRLRLRRRIPEVVDGLARGGKSRPEWTQTTLPAGVIMVALDERYAEGTFRSNVSNSVGIADAVGRLSGGAWTFQGGRLSRFTYGEGGDMFQQSFDRAGRGRDLPGVLSIGLNPRIATAPLLQDQALGNLTLQIGRNDQVGGSNSVPWWAWLILRGGTLRVDGEPLLRAGKLPPPRRGSRRHRA
jgi:leucyl aminopeptidase (aminopeptidase T)/transposase